MEHTKLQAMLMHLLNEKGPLGSPDCLMACSWLSKVHSGGCRVRVVQVDHTKVVGVLETLMYGDIR